MLASDGNVKSYETSDENVVGDVGLNTGAYDAGIVLSPIGLTRT